MITPQKPRYCAVCGADISDRHGSAMYCAECARQISNTRRRNRTKKRKPTGESATISKVAQQARDAGMSYGKFVARMGGQT